MNPETLQQRRLRKTLNVSGVSGPLQSMHQNNIATTWLLRLMLKDNNASRIIDLVFNTGCRKTRPVDFARPKVA
jgi:hypothetical protein